MVPGYHLTFARHALQSVNRSIDTPDIQLGIGDAEILNPITNKQNFKSTQKNNVSVKVVDDQDLIFMRLGQAPTTTDAPKQFYQGEVL